MILLFFTGVMLALFFAGAESAMLALSDEAAPREGLPARLEALLGDPQRLRNSLVVGNLAAVTLAGAALTVFLVRGHGAARGVPLAALVLAPLVTLFTEVLPRALIRRHPGSFLAAIALPVAVVSRLLRPAAWAGDWLTERLVGAAESRLGLQPADAPESQRSSLFDGTEPERENYVDGVIEFADTLVKEIMVPRRDMIALPIDAPLGEALRVVRETQYSRIPLFRGKPENVVGVLHAKDLLPRIGAQEPEPGSLRELARQPFYVPGVMTLDDLLAELQLKGTHMAFVVDEFGSTAGLVTLENVLEEIFGDIQDEHDQEERPIRRAGRGVWIIDGTTSIDEVESALRVELPESGCETLGGFVFQSLGHLPVPGESCRIDGLSFEVLRVESRRVREVRLQMQHARETWRAGAGGDPS